MKQDNLSAEMMSGGFFSDFGRAVTKGDLFVKLSMLWMGAGYEIGRASCRERV